MPSPSRSLTLAFSLSIPRMGRNDDVSVAFSITRSTLSHLQPTLSLLKLTFRRRHSMPMTHSRRGTQAHVRLFPFDAIRCMTGTQRMAMGAGDGRSRSREHGSGFDVISTLGAPRPDVHVHFPHSLSLLCPYPASHFAFSPPLLGCLHLWSQQRSQSCTMHAPESKSE